MIMGTQHEGGGEYVGVYVIKVKTGRQVYETHTICCGAIVRVGLGYKQRDQKNGKQIECNPGRKVKRT